MGPKRRSNAGMVDGGAVDGETIITPEQNGAMLPLRRSGRVRKPPGYSKLDSPKDKTQASQQEAPASPSVRRNPKRKSVPEVFDIRENLLETSLGPWKENEQTEWPSWVELESDPAFFTAILGLLGVKGAKIEEVLSVDEDSFAALSHPVYGLVFLYEYIEEEGGDEVQGSEGVWFANQTTANACATIALLNIIMNAEGLELGEKLRQFKEESLPLSPPLRGNLITNSTWIRLAHNSFARRLDLLNAALCLENEVDKRKKRARATNRKAKSKSKSVTDSAYHFIAYVPVGRKVWQLDGLKTGPVCIGEYPPDKPWTSVMQPVLEKRMMRYETERLSFSLMALCGDNFSVRRRRLAENIRILHQLNAKLSSANQEWTASRFADADPDVIYRLEDTRLAAYQLDAEDILTCPDRTESANFPETQTVQAGLEVWEKTAKEQKRIRNEYEAELRTSLGGQESAAAAVFGRTKDHTAAIHEWVKKLAQHGVLKELHEKVQMQSGF